MRKSRNGQSGLFAAITKFTVLAMCFATVFALVLTAGVLDVDTSANVAEADDSTGGSGALAVSADGFTNEYMHSQLHAADTENKAQYTITLADYPNLTSYAQAYAWGGNVSSVGSWTSYQGASGDFGATAVGRAALGYPSAIAVLNVTVPTVFTNLASMGYRVDVSFSGSFYVGNSNDAAWGFGVVGSGGLMWGDRFLGDWSEDGGHFDKGNVAAVGWVNGGAVQSSSLLNTSGAATSLTAQMTNLSLVVFRATTYVAFGTSGSHIFVDNAKLTFTVSHDISDGQAPTAQVTTEAVSTDWLAYSGEQWKSGAGAEFLAEAVKYNDNFPEGEGSDLTVGMNTITQGSKTLELALKEYGVNANGDGVAADPSAANYYAGIATVSVYEGDTTGDPLATTAVSYGSAVTEQFFYTGGSGSITLTASNARSQGTLILTFSGNTQEELIFVISDSGGSSATVRVTVQGIVMQSASPGVINTNLSESDTIDAAEWWVKETTSFRFSGMQQEVPLLWFYAMDYSESAIPAGGVYFDSAATSALHPFVFLEQGDASAFDFNFKEGTFNGVNTDATGGVNETGAGYYRFTFLAMDFTGKVYPTITYYAKVDCDAVTVDDFTLGYDILSGVIADGDTGADGVITNTETVWAGTPLTATFDFTPAFSGNRVRILGADGNNYYFYVTADGTISGNRTSFGFGGGVYVGGGTFTMQGGTIGGSEEGAGNSAISGGGVYFSGGTFTMSGGTISGNSAISYGGGVYFSGTEFTMQGGTIAANTASSSGGGVYVNGGEATMSGGYLGGTIAKNKGSISVSGGYFEKDPQAYLAGGYTVVMFTEDSGDENYKEGFPYAVYKSGDEAAGGYALSVKGSLVYEEEALTADDFAVTVPEGYTGTPSWQYKEQGGSDWADGFPADAGKYTVKATFPADADHAGAVVEVSFTVAPLPIDVIWELMDQDSLELQTPEGNEYSVPYCVGGYSVQARYTWLESSDAEANITILVSVDGGEAVFTDTTSLKEPGSYTVTASVYEARFIGAEENIDPDNYTITNDTISVTIAERRALTADDFAISSQEVTYNGEEQQVGIAPKEGVNCGKITVIYYDENDEKLKGAPVDAGEYTFTIDVAAGGNFDGAEDLFGAGWTFTIKTKTITRAMISGVADSYEYTGSQIQPEVSVKDGDILLQEGIDYIVSYSGGEGVGTLSGNVIVAGRGNYAGSAGKAFAVTAKVISSAVWTVNGVAVSGSSYTAAYTGSDWTIAATAEGVIVNGVAEQVEIGFSLLRTKPSTGFVGSVRDPGTYSTYNMKVNSVNGDSGKKNNYKLDIRNVTFIVTEAEIAEIAVLPYAGTFDGQGHDAALSYSAAAVGGQPLTWQFSLDGVSYDSAMPQVTDAGEYTLYYKVSAPNHRETSGSVAVNVEAKALTQDMVSGAASSYIYTGEAIKPAVTVKDGETALVLDTDYTVEYGNNTDAAEVGSVIVTGMGNYADEVVLAFSITKADPAYTVPENLSVCVGYTLADVKLPDGWAWENGTLSVGAAGENKFYAVFTPEDTENYNTVRAELALTVNEHTGGTATCENKAVCSVCGEAYGELAAHTPETVPGKAATCTETGLTEGSKCSVCGDILAEQETIPALDHDYTNVAPVWNWNGLTSASASFTCTREGCGHVEVVTAVITNEVTTEPACEETGVRTYTAAVPFGGKQFTDTETEVIAAAGHTAGASVRENEKAPTCTEDGSYDEVVYCTACEKELSRKTVTVGAAGHTAGASVRENEVAATCTEDGSYDEVVYCTVCEEELSRKTVTVGAAGHSPETVPGKDATCTESGLTDGEKCSVCGEMLKEQEEISALGHDFGDWSVTVEAGIGQEGEEQRTCSRCGEAETRIIPAEEFPLWLILLIVLLCILLIGGAVVLIVVYKKKRRE